MIAISYRREDSLPIAGRLYDRLEAEFGKHNVFMDFDSIQPGLDFREQIKQTIERANLLIAIIGPHWLGEQPDASRRIDDPDDFVRLEIAYALKCGIPVIPVLVNNTPMPKREKLPPDIEGLVFRHALPLDSGLDFHQHTNRLISGICDVVDVALPSETKPEVRHVARRSSERHLLTVDAQKKIVGWRTVILLTLVGLAAAAMGFYIFSQRSSSKAPPYSIARAPSAISEKSIAVLPFENLSSDKENAYFADGIQDEILTRLSKIADLKVISRTSTQHYKSAPENLPEIARQLGVAHILEGSVQKSADAVRVNVQLIKADNDSDLSSKTWTGLLFFI